MITGTAPPGYGRLGFGVSLALHVGVLAFVAAAVDLQAPGKLMASERGLVTYPLQIEHAVRRLVARAAHPHAATARQAVHVAAKPLARTTPELAHIVPRAPARIAPHRTHRATLPVVGEKSISVAASAAAAPPVRRRAAPLAHAPLAGTDAPGLLAAPTPVPSAMPTAPATPVALARTDPAAAPLEDQRAKRLAFVPPGNGGWAQNYPARLLDGAAVARVAALAGGHIHLRIDIDENGRPVDVVFLTPLPDMQARAAIENRLMASRYLPAECSGVRCSGSIDLES